MERNTLFAEGNNIAAAAASSAATHFLLLNSDVEVLDDGWIGFMLDQHRRGITALGVSARPDRADGFCLLVDADIYRRYELDHVNHQWWWAVTKLQAELLRDGYTVRAIREHSSILRHFGGASGQDFVGARGMEIDPALLVRWFSRRQPQIIG